MFIGQNGENAATEYQKGILNMKHTKYWMTLALCAAMALSLAACGSQFELETDDLWIKVMRVKEHRVENTVVKKLPPKEKGEQEERKERE